MYPFSRKAPKYDKYTESTLITYNDADSSDVKAEKARQWFEQIYYPQLLTNEERQNVKMVQNRQFNNKLQYLSNDLTLAAQHIIMYNSNSNVYRLNGFHYIDEGSLTDVYINYIRSNLPDSTISKFDNKIDVNKATLEATYTKYKTLLQDAQSRNDITFDHTTSNLITEYSSHLSRITEGIRLLTQYKSKYEAGLRTDYKPYMISKINKVLEYVETINKKETEADKDKAGQKLATVSTLTTKYHELLKRQHELESEAEKLERHPAFQAATDARVKANNAAAEAKTIKTELVALGIDIADSTNLGGNRKSMKRRKANKRGKSKKRKANKRKKTNRIR